MSNISTIQPSLENVLINLENSLGKNPKFSASFQNLRENFKFLDQQIYNSQNLNNSESAVNLQSDSKSNSTIQYDIVVDVDNFDSLRTKSLELQHSDSIDSPIKLNHSDRMSVFASAMSTESSNRNFIETQGSCDLDKLDRGWLVSLGPKGIDIDQNKPYSVVGLIGPKNRGKSFLMQKLRNEACLTKYIPTKGISVIHDKSTIYIDTAGINGAPPVSTHTKYDYAAEENQRLIDDLTQNFVAYAPDMKHMVHHLILVVGDLDFEDQQFIHKMLSIYHEHSNIYVVHNFSQIGDIATLEEKIQKNIVEVFKTKENIHMGKRIFVAQQDDKQLNENSRIESVKHLILAKEGTKAGLKYNDATIEFLRGKIAIFPGGTTVNILKRFIWFLKSSISNYIKTDAPKNIDISYEFDAVRKGHVIKFKNPIKFQIQASRHTPPFKITRYELANGKREYRIDIEIGYYEKTKCYVDIRKQSDGHYLTYIGPKMKKQMRAQIREFQSEYGISQDKKNDDGNSEGNNSKEALNNIHATMKYYLNERITDATEILDKYFTGQWSKGYFTVKLITFGNNCKFPKILNPVASID
jgi:hypothetical protein